MSLQQNTDRIRTTHIGSLPRPHELLDLMKAKFNGFAYDQELYDSTIAKSVAEAVRRQAEQARHRNHDGFLVDQDLHRRRGAALRFRLAAGARTRLNDLIERCAGREVRHILLQARQRYMPPGPPGALCRAWQDPPRL